ncbi:putative RNA polymerase II subunit B1 CTD phosphatase-like protein [Emericellopsis cladophorae]|uniref:RNA polymerase II subunit B1 CTD phosphatase RPAP2 homolog n=1 Tax=Emericellopsis cladophorae TaxID=2686198 RepID=A0A9Q0BCL9_9HYPO|nr:putative RNA polymerase II subunit B1 CTD phosphatase-like protein [Emericellopsis cladophorae]KAI6779901.1 putative RNA polymerase II subunit B1 CTD phosphatase-like protein [Emericellopsis cladophorae]
MDDYIIPKSIRQPSRPSKEDARALAVQHATILQHRKDLEAQILSSLIYLSTFPPNTTVASQPNPADAREFRNHIRLFQPSDYDDLIAERNVNDLCGYALCPRENRKTGRGGEWTLAPDAGGIVRRKEVEMWCTQKCKRRALYVKVQLSETAAWERAGIPDIEICLYEEPSTSAPETEEDATARKMSEMKLEDGRQTMRDSARLALERGEVGSLQPGAKTAVGVMLQEHVVESAPPTGVFEDDDGDHMMVEGYRSKIEDNPNLMK